MQLFFDCKRRPIFRLFILANMVKIENKKIGILVVLLIIISGVQSQFQINNDEG